MKTEIELAKQAGWEYADDDRGFEPLWRFAELVRADERARMAEQPAQQEPDLSMREPSAIRDRLIQAGWTPPSQQQEPVRVPVTDNTYNYAKSLAEAIFKQHFASDEHYASGRIVWGVNDTVIGILTQIDNMVADMVRRPAQQEPVAWMQNTTAGLYVIDHCDEWHCIPLYTSPPAQRKPLTRERVREICEGSGYDKAAMQERADFINGIRHAEAAHGIKENT